ncbi:XdhC family protein [Streptomyces sp. NPDC059862]|uniref:XdhC family protein n=1 Tax=Streptomyces sp. NPDC059862 TaxID=3346975 RepID=UPI0036624B7A
MRDILPQLARWWRESRPFALATLVDAAGSTPFPVGTAMAVDGEGTVLGAISGGCVDADVAATAQEVLRDGRPVLRRYGPAGPDSGPFDVGLTCGGTVTVWTEPVPADGARWLPVLAEAVRAGRPVAHAVRLYDTGSSHLVVLPDGGREGSLGTGEADRDAEATARLLLPEGGTAVISTGPHPDVFVAAHRSPPLLTIVTWTPVAGPLARIGAELGYRPVVLEHRPAFAAQARDAGVEVLPGLPQTGLRTLRGEGTLDRRSAVVVLTHDARIDVPALLEAAEAGVGYLGATGSAATVRDRSGRLRAAGLDEAGCSAIHSPIGLPLGGRAPAEVATAIAAQLVAVRVSQRHPDPRRAVASGC